MYARLVSNILIPVVSGYSKVLAGYSYGEADAGKLLAQTRTNAFIHGDNDKFVPTKFMKPVYEASNGPKKNIWYQALRTWNHIAPISKV